MAGEIWPPIYDFEELCQTIQQLVGSASLEKRFYEPSPLDAGFCQGDIVRFDAEFPYLDEEGQPAAEELVRHWMILGNTCDLDREVGQVPWSQIVPVWDLGGPAEVATTDVGTLRSYRNYRQFYVPAWNDVEGDHYYVADLPRPVTIHKTGLGCCRVAARLTFEGGVLFPPRLIRFLSLDDRREGAA